MRLLLLILVCISLECYSQELLIVCPPDVEMECSEDTGEYGEATAEGDCSGIVISFSDNIIEGICPANYTIERTWLATNDCEESVECTQEIVIEDTSAPSFSSNYELILDCMYGPDSQLEEGFIEPEELEFFEIFMVETECSEFTIEMSNVPVSGNCFGQTLRTYNLIDQCENSASIFQSISYGDTIPPQIICPNDTTIAIINSDYYSAPFVQDNCSSLGYVDFDFVDEITSQEIPYTILRNHIVSDCFFESEYGTMENNQSTCIQQITVVSFGCTDSEACNYDSFAFIEDSSCFYTLDECSDDNDLTVLDLVNENCECNGFYPGDINQDGIVNSVDLNLILILIGQECENAECVFDVNGDGFISVSDLIQMLNLFGYSYT